MTARQEQEVPEVQAEGFDEDASILVQVLAKGFINHSLVVVDPDTGLSPTTNEPVFMEVPLKTFPADWMRPVHEEDEPVIEAYVAYKRKLAEKRAQELKDNPRLRRAPLRYKGKDYPPGMVPKHVQPPYATQKQVDEGKARKAQRLALREPERTI